MIKGFKILITEILKFCPGGELRACDTISRRNSDCVRHRNHHGRCEDAWGYRWERSNSL